MENEHVDDAPATSDSPVAAQPGTRSRKTRSRRSRAARPVPILDAPEDLPASAEPAAQAEGESAPACPEPARTPADSVPVPEPDADGQHDLSRPEYLLNRELTWLNFNFRVLHEASDARTPLLERLKFIAIVSSNVDEFVMKRIGGLKQLVAAGVQEPSADGRTPLQQLSECNDLVRRLEKHKRSVLLDLLPLLEESGIRYMPYADLSEQDREHLRQVYIENFYPLITPQATDPAHPFPFISNLSLNLLVSLRYPEESTQRLARVKVPVGVGVPRLFRLHDSKTFVRIEDVMAGNLDLLFPGMEIDEVAMFRLTRNANTERDEEKADDLMALIESELSERKFAPIVRLEVSQELSAHHRGMLAAELGLDEDADVFDIEGMMGMSDLMEIIGISDPELHDVPFHPVDHPGLDPERNIFHVIRDSGSVLLHHPYVSFSSSVERFLREASRDPKVRAVKMCLYRTSADTKVLSYLIDAAQNGKQVAVVVELKARFDEEANIRWASRLEEAGIHVTYGVVGLKTHCKVVLVVRQDYDGLRRYAHLGTGNYHAGTARLYSDLGLLTSDKLVGQDLTELFNYLSTGYKPKRRYDKILPAPKHCRQGLLTRIEREIELHTEESPGLIQIKMNALEDPGLTRALYRASQAGVRVDLIIRDTCRLRPGVPGLSETCRVISVVGRFLEHARVVYFQNGGDEEYFIGSADMMRRNLNSRVEVLAPVDAPDLREELRFLLDTQLADERSAWEMRSDGSYVQRSPGEGDPDTKGSQEILIDSYARRQKKERKLKRRKPRGMRRNIRS